jgi:hypothetical protein
MSSEKVKLDALVFLRGVKDNIRAWFRANRALSIAIRKGEQGREKLDPNDPFIDYILWSFELGLWIKPIIDEVAPQARGLIIGWAIAMLKEIIFGPK